MNMTPTRDFPTIKTHMAKAGGQDTAATPAAEAQAVKFHLAGVTVRYGARIAVDNVTLPVYRNLISAIIGPSGCGKSTLLRTLNRMNDSILGFGVSGKILLEQQDIYSPAMDVIRLRQRVGMVFQQPNPFPKSIFDNVAYGLRINGLCRNRAEMDERVEQALQQAALWEEVRDNLERNALQLSGGQQQRLCIARALAVRPEVVLMDEPASALDPISTAKIEELMFELKKDYTIVIVTHNMQQAARVSDYTAFLLNGALVEFNPTRDLFTTPVDNRTEAYITGRFG
jgi:phosphate transport system ATP-binding protein